MAQAKGYSLEEALGVEATPSAEVPQKPTQIYFPEKHQFSYASAPKKKGFTLEEALADGPSPETLRERERFAEMVELANKDQERIAQEQGARHEWMKKSIKTSPKEVGQLLRGSIVGNLRSAAQEGKLDWNKFSNIIRTGLGHVENLPEVVKNLKGEFDKDPKGTLNFVVNTLIQDPELLVLGPRGVGGRLASAAASLGSRAGRVGEVVGGVGGRTVEGAISGAGVNTAIEAAQMLKDYGYIMPENLAGPAQFGAALGGGLHGVLGRTEYPIRGPKIRMTDPKQMFADDAAYEAFRDGFRPPRGTEVGPARKIAPKGEQELVEPGSREWGASDVAKSLGLAGLGTGLWAMDMEDEALLTAMATPAIKGKGGNWHPQAAKTLVSAMARQDINEIGNLQRRAETYPNLAEFDKKMAAAKVLPDWSMKAVERYLNRYAGLGKDDPLAEVVLPSGKTWEAVTDKAIIQEPAHQVYARNQAELPPNTPMNERIWDVRTTQRQAGIELTSYLSHVGDFLRQNVTPEKLKNYDLVRAVKETAANDARVAKEMERASKASMKDLPVYKDYPEKGMKWVEYKLPEKLTPEQGKGVEQVGKDVTVKGEEQFRALDAKGKPLVSSYTGEQVLASTPEEAHLAGLLAQEGNVMGHCVGGYCPQVASGETRILSLKDAKGESHVTVEVEPKGKIWNNDLATAKQIEQIAAARKKNETLADAAARLFPEQVEFNQDILQIKGKQNRAPDPRYLPFVQDLVKSGKWGEVGDLEGTGLYPMRTTSGSLYPRGWERRVQRAHEKLEPGFYTEKEIEAANLKDIDLNTFREDLAQNHPSVSLDLRESKNGTITLANIELKDEAYKFRAPTEGGTLVGRAKGQEAIGEITSFADANKRGIVLDAVPREGGPPIEKLVEIYKRFGFKESPDQPFPEMSRRMYRNPKGEESERVSGAEQSGAGGGLPPVQEPPAGGAGRGAAEERGPGLPPEQGEARGAGPGRGERGEVDKRLLASLAGAGIGAVVGAQLLEDEPVRGILWGAMALGILPWMKRGIDGLRDGADVAGGLLSTRLRNENIPIAHRAQMHVRETLRDTARYGAAVTPFLKVYSSLKDPELRRVLTENTPSEIERSLLATGRPEVVQSWMQFQTAMKEIGQRLKDAGVIDSVLEGYIPRVVKDPEGLFQHLEERYGKEHKTELEKRLAEGERKAAKDGGLTEIQKSKIINDYLRYVGMNAKPGFAKERTIRGITPEMLQFYDDIPAAVEHYIDNSVKVLAKASFFGRHQVKKEGVLDVDESAGRLVKEQIDAGKMTWEQAEKVRKLINSYLGPQIRFLDPRGTAAQGIHGIQNLTYAVLLGNVVSAAIQLADQAIPIVANGFVPTLRAVGRRMTGNMKFDLEEAGLVKHISDEFQTRGATARFLNHTFKSGFALLDRFGKSTLGESSYIKYAGMTKTPKGLQRFAEEYGEAFGDKFPQLVDDLREGRTTDLTQSLAVIEIARRHPISRLEAPEWYNKIPDLQPMLMLKRYMLKQYDWVRRDAYNEWRKGNYAKGTGFLLRYATVMAVAGTPINMIQDWLENKPMEEDAWMPRLDNVLKTFGASEYVLDQIKQGKPLRAIGGVLAPPFAAFEDILMAKKEGIKKIPHVGKVLYGQIYEKEVARKAEQKRLQQERANDPFYQQRLKEERKRRREREM